MERRVKTERNRLRQAQASNRTARNIKRIEHHEETLAVHRVEILANDCSGGAFTGVCGGNKDGLASEEMSHLSLVDVDAVVSPVRMDELVKELRTGVARSRDSQHPEIAVRLAGPPRIDGRKIRGQAIT